MEFELLRGMFVFATTIQSVVKSGWELKHEYGERGLISDRIIAKKGDEEITCYSVGDLESLTQDYREWCRARYGEKQQPWYKRLFRK